MDPAEPYYGVMDPSIWVSKDDAEFVDVIHVNSDTLLGVRYSSIKIELALISRDIFREACPCTVLWGTSISTRTEASTSPVATTSWVWRVVS